MSKNFASGLVAIVLGGIYVITAILLPAVDIGDVIGPELFPIVVGSAAIIAGIFLCVHDVRSGKGERADMGFVKDKDVWIKILLTVAAGIIYGLVVDTVGYTISTVAFMIFASSLINKGRHKQNIIFSLIFSVVTYGVFGLALQLSLPRGIIENLLPF